MAGLAPSGAALFAFMVILLLYILIIFAYIGCMNSSLNEIASQILNAVHAGLKTPNNFAISIRQIKDEVAQRRNTELLAEIASGRGVDLEPYRQTIFKLPLYKKDFSGTNGYTTTRREYHASIPKPLFAPGLKPVAWVTAMDRSFPFKVIYGNDIFHTRFDKYSGNAPTVWIQDTNLWLLNPPISNIQHISIRYILENPRAVNGVAGMKFMDDDPYPAPGAVMDRIRSRLIDEYIRHYRLGSLQPTLMAGDINVSTGGGK